MSIQYLLYTDQTGELIGLDEVQLLDPIPEERIPELIALLKHQDRYVAYQAGLILAAWGIQEGISFFDFFIEERFDKIMEFEPHRIWGEDNVYDVIAEAIEISISVNGYSQQEAEHLFIKSLSLYGECFFESKLKGALLKLPVSSLIDNIKKAQQAALDTNRIYQASQLLPVIAKYDTGFAQTKVPLFQSLVKQDDRIAYNLDEMKQYM